MGISFQLQQVLYKFFFWFGQILFNLARMFAAQHASFNVSTDHLFDNLESGKRNYCFGKIACKKSSILVPKNLYEPCSNAFLGAFFALCGRGIQPPLNACVVVGIIKALILFSINYIVVHPVLFFNKWSFWSGMTDVYLRYKLNRLNSSIRSQCEPPNRGTQRWFPPKCTENTF